MLTNCNATVGGVYDEDSNSQVRAARNSSNNTDDEDDDGEFGAVQKISKTPHPKQATAWETRKLLLTSKLPATESLNSCQEELRSLASEAGSEEDMVRLQEAVASAARRNPQLYHWCFYRIVTLIDWSLDKDEGVLPRDKIPRFFSRMKGLWALARALDDIYRTRLYFSYLRIRYMQISKDYFGRSLDVITEPLGSAHKNENSNSKKKSKPAGNFNDEDMNF